MKRINNDPHYVFISRSRDISVMQRIHYKYLGPTSEPLGFTQVEVYKLPPLGFLK